MLPTTLARRIGNRYTSTCAIVALALATNAVHSQERISLPDRPHSAAFASDSRSLVLQGSHGNDLFSLDLISRKVAPFDVSPSGSLLGLRAGKAVVLNVRTETAVEVDLESSTESSRKFEVPDSSDSILDQKGKYLYVSGLDRKSIRQFDYKTGELIRVLAVGNARLGAWELSPNGKYITATSPLEDDAVQVLDTATGRLTTIEANGRSLNYFATVDLDEKHVYVGNIDDVRVFRIADGVLVNQFDFRNSAALPRTNSGQAGFLSDGAFYVVGRKLTVFRKRVAALKLEVIEPVGDQVEISKKGSLWLACLSPDRKLLAISWTTTPRELLILEMDRFRPKE